MNCLYCLDINLLSVISFANIFSHSVGLLFLHLVDGFLWCVNAFKFNYIQFLYFCFDFLCLLRQIPKYICILYVIEYSTCVFFQKFYGFTFTFRSLIHFEFILIYGVRKCLNFTLLHVTVQFPQHYLIEETVFSPLYIFPLLSEIN